MNAELPVPGSEKPNHIHSPTSEFSEVLSLSISLNVSLKIKLEFLSCNNKTN